MGMEVALIAAMIASQAIGTALAPDGQELKSYEDEKWGDVDLDPRAPMGEFRQIWGDQFNRVLDRAYVNPYKVKTTANPLPAFVGGGLPMAIGVPGQDPERLKKRVPVSRGGTMPDAAGPSGETPTFGANPVPGGDPAFDQALQAFSLLGVRR